MRSLVLLFTGAVLLFHGNQARAGSDANLCQLASRLEQKVQVIEDFKKSIASFTRPQLHINPKHKKELASLFPGQETERILFESAVPAVNGKGEPVFWAKDKDGRIHRWSRTTESVYHWSGCVGQDCASRGGFDSAPPDVEKYWKAIDEFEKIKKKMQPTGS